jgi:WD40 repeat protein
MRYAAFISYRHVDPDRRWAKWLHSRLESYRLPKGIANGIWTSRVGRCFRDEEELSASADLTQEIRDALEDSKYLVVVCSPQTPQSRWVNQEIKEFAALGRRDNILALLIAGEPDVAFPPALTESGKEPLAADVRDRSRRGVKEAELRILATILGCRFDDLRQREQERRVRRAMFLTGVMAAAAVLFAVISIIAIMQRDTAKSRELAVSSSYVLNDDPELSVLLALEALSTRNTEEAVDALRQSLLRFSLRAVLKGHRGPVEVVAFSPYGEIVLTSGQDGTVRLWNPETGIQTLVFRAENGPITTAAFSPNGHVLLTASKNENIAHIWDVSSGALLHSLYGHTAGIEDAEFSSDSRLAVTASKDHTARVWDVASGQLKVVVTGHTDEVTSAAFSLDDRYVLTASLDSKAAKWDLATGKMSDKFMHDGEVYRIALSNNGAFAATTERGSANVEKASDLRAWCVLNGHDDDHEVVDVAFNRDSTAVATAGTDGLSLVAALSSNPPNGQVCQSVSLVGHNGSVNKVIFAADGRRVITASDDHTARIWDVDNGQLLEQLVGHRGPVTDLAVSPDGRYLATASADGTARIWQIDRTLPRLALPGRNMLIGPDSDQVFTWSDTRAAFYDLSTGRQLAKLDGLTASIGDAAFSADGKILLTADNDGAARLWDAATGRALCVLRKDAAPLTHAAFSPNAGRVAVVSRAGIVRVWDTRANSLVAEWAAHTAEVNSIAFSVDGRRLVTASEDHTVKIWNTANGQSLLVYRGHMGPVKRAMFTLDGARVISVSPGTGNTTTREWNHEPVRVWNSRTGAEVFDLNDHSDIVTDAILSPDGKTILTTSYDTSSIAWNAATGTELSQLRGHTAEVDRAAFSRDSHFAVTTGGDCSLRIWDVRSGRNLLAVGKDRGCF